MEGPRAVKASEIPSLSRLVDSVFMGGRPGKMFQTFPRMFDKRNQGNLLVFSDGGEVVSHVGMTEDWACVGGCTVGVACIGAVSTHEAYRGKGLATELFEAAQRKAVHDGMDFMMISGGRGLYRRAGAANVGFDFEATVNETSADILHDPSIRLEPVKEHDLPDCILAYQRKRAHFIRPLEDWQTFLGSPYCMCAETDFCVVRAKGVSCGYFIVGGRSDLGEVRVFEFAGEPTTLAATLKSVIVRGAAKTLRLHLQADDTTLRLLLEHAGVTMTPSPTSGTYLLLNFPQLMKRLHPWFEARIGRESAKSLIFQQEENQFTFGTRDNKHTVEGRMAAAELIFGRHEKLAPEGLLRTVFPIPSLWYGINYV